MAKKQKISILADISILMSKQGIKISLMIIKRRLNKQSLYKLQLLVKLLLLDKHRLNREI